MWLLSLHWACFSCFRHFARRFWNQTWVEKLKIIGAFAAGGHFFWFLEILNFSNSLKHSNFSKFNFSKFWMFWNFWFFELFEPLIFRYFECFENLNFPKFWFIRIFLNLEFLKILFFNFSKILNFWYFELFRILNVSQLSDFGNFLNLISKFWIFRIFCYF